ADLLLPDVAFLAHGIIVADLPKHAAVRADRTDYGDATNNGESRQSVQHIGGHDKLSELAWRGSNIERVVLSANHWKAPQASLLFLMLCRPSVPGPARYPTNTIFR